MYLETTKDRACTRQGSGVILSSFSNPANPTIVDCLVYALPLFLLQMCLFIHLDAGCCYCCYAGLVEESTAKSL